MPAKNIEPIVTPMMSEDDRIIADAIARLKKKLVRNGQAFTSPERAKKFAYLKLAKKEHEVFAVLHLDTQNRLLDYEELFRGTINAASVYPRELAKSCLEKNTAAVLLVHNHPSGECQPSQADVRITTRIKEALILLDVRVIDHLVVGNKEVYSFAEAGQLF